MTELKEENAKITNVTLGRHPHYRIMEMSVSIEYSGGGQSIGGYCLDSYNKETDRREGTAYGLDFIIRMLETVGVDSIDDMLGKSVRIRHEGWGGKALEIGNYLNDEWFNLNDHADLWKDTQ